MAETAHPGETSRTVTLTADDTAGSTSQGVTAVRLKLTKPKSDKKVNWTEETVDNEHLNRKKSKCCCIYKKPRSDLEESSDDDDDLDCDNCRGHVEKRSPDQSQRGPSDPGCSDHHHQAAAASA